MSNMNMPSSERQIFIPDGGWPIIGDRTMAVELFETAPLESVAGLYANCNVPTAPSSDSGVRTVRLFLYTVKRALVLARNLYSTTIQQRTLANVSLTLMHA